MAYIESTCDGVCPECGTETEIVHDMEICQFPCGWETAV
ncbi:Uncharacterised protein [Mycobacteroides abscessus]|uniref:Uncharacterized protein n=3 Tax=Mycobacteroides abscessus TaxID=36809 RepID=A0AB74FES0_9MYCO|nr:Uncharacterised protein [Mycobacteroides abscessus]SHY02166.1 Uncharacterised protein [Mycobacteroides abscessus subsp. abscessus]SKD20818.1 Uncharacterised protein [Mycobacteroides abscessus subsp. massiliense]CPS66411.1 Uncharacterised protein [Mycobacteroides abscessus]CPT26297.1 Uncharacterised protein [Mycobacteroides abscessus]